MNQEALAERKLSQQRWSDIERDKVIRNRTIWDWRKICCNSNFRNLQCSAPCYKPDGEIAETDIRYWGTPNNTGGYGALGALELLIIWKEDLAPRLKWALPPLSWFMKWSSPLNFNKKKQPTFQRIMGRGSKAIEHEPCDTTNFWGF